MDINLEFFVDSTLLMRVFAVSNDAVSDDVSPKYYNQSPPAVIQTLFESSFSGHMSTTVLA